MYVGYVGYARQDREFAVEGGGSRAFTFGPDTSYLA